MSKDQSLPPNQSTAVFLDGVSVIYRVPMEKIASIKEFAIKKVMNKLKYRQFHALNNIQVTVNKGEIFGIIGRNGAGKSTLLKVISRVLYPTNGRVWINGTVAPLLELGAGFHPELTGMENIYLNGTLLGHSRKEIDQKRDEIIAFSEVGDFIHAPLRTYSSGMNARLGFSIATAWSPDILLLDEVLSVGDTAFREKCQKRMQEIMHSGSTILLVSHDIDIIKSTCDRAMLLDHGQVVSVGAIENITADYKNLLDKGETG